MEYIEGSLNFDNGGFATVHSSWLDPNKVREMIIVGTRRMIVYNDNEPLEKIKMITAHLGNGCSITCIKDGKSLETSMGLTPLNGLIMGQRSGDLDSEGRRIVEDVSAEVATVNRIHALRAAGLTLRQIAAKLAAEGVPTKRGGAWSHKVVRSVLMRAAA